MATKRLNTKFLISAAFPVLVIVGGLAAWKILPRFFPQIRWVLRGTPTQHMTRGQQLYDQGKFDEAREEFAYAMYVKGSGDAPLYTSLGDCYSHLVTKDIENLLRARQCWDQALSIDPTYMPALQRMLELLEDDARINRGSGARLIQQWDGVSAAAAKVLAIDPQDRKARMAKNHALIEKWQAKVEIPDGDIEKALAELVLISQEQPFDADTLFYVMQVLWTKAQERIAQTDRNGAQILLDQVVDLASKGLKAHPDDALMHYRAGQALRVVGYASRLGDQQPPKFAEQTREEFRIAAATVKPDHRMYAEIKLYYGKFLEGLNETQEAENLYRALLAERPDEMQARIALAELISRRADKRAEAIALLEQAPPSDPVRYAGMKAYQSREYEQIALFDLINIKLDVLAGLKGQQGYDVLLKQIDDGYAKLTSTPGVADRPLGLQTLGRIELAKGQNLQAVQTLNRALNMMPPTISQGPDSEVRYRLMFFLAGAYMITEQNGEAETLLNRIVQDIPQFYPGRIMLAQLYLNEGKPELARPQAEILSKMLPDSPAMTKLIIYTLDKDLDKDKIAELYGKLPQEKPVDWVDKAQVAVYLNHREEAIKLLEQYRTAVPGDLNANVSLARVYAGLGDKTKAVSLIDEALAKMPDSAQLKMIRAEVSGADMVEARHDLVDGITEPFRKAMLQFELAVQDGHREEANQFLDTAAKLKPDDGRVIELQFNRAVSRKDWEHASQYVELLARQNRDMVGGLLYRVRLAIARKELDHASDLALQLVKQMPEFGQSYIVMGQVQKAQKKYIEALQSFETAMQKQPSLSAISELIDISYVMNNPAQARKYIEQGRKAFPDYVPLHESELAYEMKYGDPEKVLAPREQMLQTAIDNKDSTEPRAWWALANAYLTVAHTKDTPQAARPLLEKARDKLVQATAKYPDNMDLVGLYSDTMLQLHDFASGEKAILALRTQPKWQDKPEPTVLLASYYARANKPAEQEKVLRDFLATAPNTVSVQIALSALLFDHKKVDDAMKVLDVNSTDPEIRRQRIEIQISAGQINEAQAELKTLLDSTPNPSSVLLNRQAYIYMKSGRATEALQTLEKSLAQNPDDLEAMFLKASIYLSSQKNLPDAITYLQTTRDSHFREEQSRLRLAEAYHYSNPPDEDAAIRELEDVVRLFPDSKAARLRLMDKYASVSPKRWSQAERMLKEARALPQFANDVDLMQAEAIMWLQRNDPARSASIVLAAMKLAPDNLQLLSVYCQATLAAKDYSTVIKGTDALVKAKKAPWWVYQFRGQARKGMDDKQAAMEEFQTGIDLASAANDDAAVAKIVGVIVDEIGIEPAKARVFDRADKGDNRWRLMLAVLMQKGDDLPNAITWAERVANDSKATPDQIDAARRLLGTYYLRLDPPDIEKAVQVYKKILERDPNDLVALNNLASTMILPNSKFTAKDAKPYSEKAYKIIEQTGVVNSYIWDTQGYVLVLNGQIQDGINLLQQAIDQEPIPEACYHLGVAYLALPTPRKAEAQDSLKQALALLDAATRDNKPADADLKNKIEKDLERAGGLPTTTPQQNAQ